MAPTKAPIADRKLWGICARREFGTADEASAYVEGVREIADPNCYRADYKFQPNSDGEFETVVFFKRRRKR